MPKIGLPIGLYYAPNTADDVGVPATYGAMVKMAGVTAAKVTFKVDDQVIPYEDLTQEIIRFISGAEVEISSKELSMATRATLLDHETTGGIVQVGANDTPIWLGLAFKIKRVEAGVTHYQYVRLLKGYLQMPDEEAMTREDKLNIKDYTLKFIFVPRKYDELLLEMTDSALPTYNGADATAWFTTFGVTDTTPPTIASSLPAANAANQLATVTYAWTFSEAIMPSTMIPANFFMIKDSDNTIVAGALAISVANTVVTFTPTGALTAAAVYFAVATAGIKDLCGNALAANSVRKITIAA